jgi:hypothetical protein
MWEQVGKLHEYHGDVPAEIFAIGTAPDTAHTDPAAAGRT